MMKNISFGDMINDSRSASLRKNFSDLCRRFSSFFAAFEKVMNGNSGNNRFPDRFKRGQDGGCLSRPTDLRVNLMDMQSENDLLWILLACLEELRQEMFSVQQVLSMTKYYVNEKGRYHSYDYPNAKAPEFPAGTVFRSDIKEALNAGYSFKKTKPEMFLQPDLKAAIRAAIDFADTFFRMQRLFVCYFLDGETAKEQNADIRKAIRHMEKKLERSLVYRIPENLTSEALLETVVHKLSECGLLIEDASNPIEDSKNAGFSSDLNVLMKNTVFPEKPDLYWWLRFSTIGDDDWYASMSGLRKYMRMTDDVNLPVEDDGDFFVPARGSSGSRSSSRIPSIDFEGELAERNKRRFYQWANNEVRMRRLDGDFTVPAHYDPREAEKYN